MKQPSIRELWSQHTVVVTSKCPLQCDRCRLWKPHSDPIDEEDVIDQIKKGVFLKGKLHISLVNIMGGDPISNQDILYILQYCRKHRMKVRLWTTGLAPIINLEQVLEWVDYWVIYIPSTESELYLEITGVDLWHKVKDQVEWLQDEEKSIAINYPIRKDTIQFLPELYDYKVEAHHVPLFLHYDQSEILNKDSRQFIDRFKQIKGVTVLKTKGHRPSQCWAVPYNPVDKPLRKKYLNWQECWQSLRNRYSSYFWFQKRYG